MLITNLRYLSYSSGAYNSGKNDGITLQFLCEDTGFDYHVIFNADIRRKRNVKNHRVGSFLPKGRFSVGRQSAFYKFWLSTGLNIPPRLSAFNDYMGKLKVFTFFADVAQGKRLDARSLRPLLDNLEFSNKLQTSLKQQQNKIQTRTSNNYLIEDPINTDIERKITTCLNNYDISKQVSTNISSSIIPIHEPKRVQNQTTEEWLDEYQKISRDYDGLF